MRNVSAWAQLDMQVLILKDSIPLPTDSEYKRQATLQLLEPISSIPFTRPAKAQAISTEEPATTSPACIWFHLPLMAFCVGASTDCFRSCARRFLRHWPACSTSDFCYCESCRDDSSTCSSLPHLHPQPAKAIHFCLTTFTHCTTCKIRKNTTWLGT